MPLSCSTTPPPKARPAIDDGLRRLRSFQNRYAFVARKSEIRDKGLGLSLGFVVPKSPLILPIQLQKEHIMLRISAAIAMLTMIGTSAVAVSTASADTWGCSYEKCLQACAKAGRRYCTAYSPQQMKYKQSSAVSH